LIAEELEELQEALKNNDIVETLDALIDLQYVLDGAFLSFGLHDVKEIAFAEVHRSNMSKLGEDGKPIRRESDGKVMKGPNYFVPDMSQFIKSEEGGISAGTLEHIRDLDGVDAAIHRPDYRRRAY
jgi:predicted HAD superfamily Cof-like phosphohydrolase